MNREQYAQQNTARMEKILGTSSQSGLSVAAVEDRSRNIKTDEKIRKRAHPVSAFFKTFLKSGTLPLTAAAFLLCAPFLGAKIIFPLVLYLVFLCVYFVFFVKRESGIARHKNQLIAEVRVIRDGKKQTVSPENLVMGDLLLLSPGDILYTYAHVVTDEDMTVYCRRNGGAEFSVKHGGDCFDESSEAFNTLYPGDVIREGEGKAFVTERAVAITQGETLSQTVKNHGAVCAIATKTAYLLTTLLLAIAFFRTCFTAEYEFLAKSLLLSAILISTAGCSFYPLFFDLLFLYRNRKTESKHGGAFVSVADMESVADVDSFVLSTRSMFCSARYSTRYFENAVGRRFTDKMRGTEELALFADALFALRRKCCLSMKEEAVLDFCAKYTTGKRVNLYAKTTLNQYTMTSYRQEDGRSFSLVWGDAEYLIPYLAYLSEDGKTRVLNGKLRDAMLEGVLRLKKSGYRFLLLAETQARITADTAAQSLSDLKLLGFFALRRVTDERVAQTLEALKQEEKKVFFVHDGDDAEWLKKEIRLFDGVPIIDGAKETFREELAFFVRNEDIPFCIGVHLTSVQRAQVVSALENSGRHVAVAGKRFDDHRMMRAATAAIAPAKSEAEDVPTIVLQEAAVRAREHISAQVDTVKRASGILGAFGIFSAALCASLLGRCMIALLGTVFGTIYLGAEYYALLSILFDLLAVYCFIRIDNGTEYRGLAGLVRENRKNLGFFAGFLAGSLLIGLLAVYVALHPENFAFTSGSFVFIALLFMLNVGIWRFSSAGRVSAKLLFPIASCVALVLIFVTGYFTNGRAGFVFHAEILFWALFPIALLLTVGKVFEAYFKHKNFFELGDNNERM